MMKRIICLLAVVSLFSGYLVSSSWSAQPQRRSFLGTGEGSSKGFGLRSGQRKMFTLQDRERFKKMFQRFKNKKPLNRTAP